MIARLNSVAFCGIQAEPVEVEIDIASRGFAAATIVGLPDAAVKESVERVRSAMQNSGYDFPRHKTVINLAPADLRKEGPVFDLPMALGIIFASGSVVPELTPSYLVTGELALDGRVRPMRGALSVAILAKAKGLRGMVLPAENAAEAAVVDGIEIIPVSSLTEAVGFLSGQLPIEPVCVDPYDALKKLSHHGIDFGDVRGQDHVKRALTISAAGGHNVLMLGPSASSAVSVFQGGIYGANGLSSPLVAQSAWISGLTGR